MKKIFLVLSLAITLFSCTKEAPQPTEQKQVVTYKLTAEDAVFYFETDKWNHFNELERSKNQYLNVTKGTFEYSFENEVLDSTMVHIYVGPFSSLQKVSVEISDNKHKKPIYKASWNMGFDDNHPFTIPNLDTTIVVRLR